MQLAGSTRNSRTIQEAGFTHRFHYVPALEILIKIWMSTQSVGGNSKLPEGGVQIGCGDEDRATQKFWYRLLLLDHSRQQIRAAQQAPACAATARVQLSYWENFYSYGHTRRKSQQI